METLLVQALRAHGLPEPITQFDVLDEFGNVVATTDIGIPQWKVVVEYDSMQEHTDEFQLAQDARRRNQIVAAGYLPLSARVDDLRTGGRQLVQEILRVTQPAATWSKHAGSLRGGWLGGLRGRRRRRGR
jgi:very-short-patch-repair endonuclease